MVEFKHISVSHASLVWWCESNSNLFNQHWFYGFSESAGCNIIIIIIINNVLRVCLVACLAAFIELLFENQFQ